MDALLPHQSRFKRATEGRQRTKNGILQEFDNISPKSKLQGTALTPRIAVRDSRRGCGMNTHEDGHQLARRAHLQTSNRASTKL